MVPRSARKCLWTENPAKEYGGGGEEVGVSQGGTGKGEKGGRSRRRRIISITDGEEEKQHQDGGWNSGE
jgi:hypothetical protein